MRYHYPTYRVDISPDTVTECLDAATRLLDEVGFLVPHGGFLAAMAGRPGLALRGERVHFSPELTQQYLARYRHGLADSVPGPEAEPPGDDWAVQIAGYSMAVRDLHTGEVRDGTCEDLRDAIKLAGSYGIGGMYPVMPQDVPPIMRALACFRICWEMSDSIGPYDYQQPEQVPFVYEMHQAMGKRMDLTLTVPGAMTIDPKDLDIFLEFYPLWRANRDINFRVLDYGMLGITKPLTAPGCATMQLAESLAVHMLLNLYDPDINVPIIMTVGQPTDLRHACWAFGSPRRHLYSYLQHQLQARLAGREPKAYRQVGVLLETSSAAEDEQAALEKMASGLLGALQGARTFGYAGVLCVDDVFSPVQFVIDVEIVDYIRETIQAFAPHRDVMQTAGLYDECRAVALGEDTFLSHPNTVHRFRNVLPSPHLIVREKLRPWLSHMSTLRDRAREEAIARIQAWVPCEMPADRGRQLESIYQRAQRALVG